jgi:hypothetical protein
MDIKTPTRKVAGTLTHLIVRLPSSSTWSIIFFASCIRRVENLGEKLTIAFVNL